MKMPWIPQGIFRNGPSLGLRVIYSFRLFQMLFSLSVNSGAKTPCSLVEILSLARLHFNAVAWVAVVGIFKGEQVGV